MSRGTGAAVALAAFFACAAPVRAAAPSLAALDAAARASGNRPEVARRIGTALFATIWPAQITKVRVDGVAGHLVAGIVLSGVKFHRALDERAFLREVAAIAAAAFRAAPVEEVDLWVTVPLKVEKGLPVSGDYAQPTAKTVFGTTVLRVEANDLGARLARGDAVFWDPAFRAALDARRTAPGLGQLPRVFAMDGCVRVS